MSSATRAAHRRADRSRAKPFAVGVCGFPRSGSSMLMRMLDAGGIPPVPGSAERSYEVGDVIRSRAWWMSLPGHAVKLLDALQWGAQLPTAVTWQFIWSDRDPIEQARSTVKFAGAVIPGVLDPDAEAIIARSLRADREQLLERLADHGDVLVTSFEAILSDPHDEAERIARFLELPFNPATAAVVAHERGPACAPGLDFELGQIA